MREGGSRVFTSCLQRVYEERPDVVPALSMREGQCEHGGVLSDVPKVAQWTCNVNPGSETPKEVGLITMLPSLSSAVTYKVPVS